jgi:hypothetical protein
MAPLTPDKGAELVAAVLAQQARVASDPFRFASYASDPAAFARDVLGVKLWSKQLAVLNAARDHGRVAVRSGHGVGKTYAVACLALWWLYARQGLVVTTAPTWEHVEGVLWREINAIAAAAPVPLPGEPFQTERRITGTWYAIGLSTNNVAAFSGRHHPRLLVIVDEANGVSEDVHLAVSTLAVAEGNCIVMIGNPVHTSGTFYEAFKHPEHWRTFKISCLEHPNVIAGKPLIPGAVETFWIEERKRLWGENHPFWASRVLGDFPRFSSRGIVPLAWIERATNEERRLAALAEAVAQREPAVGGLDVARYGENACVLTVRRGDAVESVESWTHTTLMETAGLAARAITERGLKALVVDASGIGAGVYDRLVEQGLPVFGYNGGHRAFTPSSYTNRRTEMWWHIRQRLEKERLWLLPEERLTADLVTPEYEVNSSGRIRLESKEELLERGVKSPDFADSLVLCFALDADPDAALEPELREGRDPVKFEPIDPLQEPVFDQLPAGF